MAKDAIYPGSYLRNFSSSGITNNVIVLLITCKRLAKPAETIISNKVGYISIKYKIGNQVNACPIEVKVKVLQIPIIF